MAEELLTPTGEKARYRIIFKRDVCIGAIACIAPAPQFWLKADDGKVDLAGAKKLDENNYELLISEKDFALNRNAAEVCPVLAIKIIDLDTGREIV